MNGSRIRWAIVTALLASHAALLLYSARVHAVTLDEGQHLAAGVHQWRTGQFYLYRVNPPLVRLLATIPVVLAGAQVPEFHEDIPGVRLEIDFHTAFAKANASNYQQLVVLGRLMGVLWSLLGGVLVFLWAKELFGANAGLLSLALWCFDPTILAHAQLLTPDIPATVAGLAATYSFWKYLRKPSMRRVCVSGFLLGIALLTKSTMLALFAIWPVLWLGYNFESVRAAVRRSGSRGFVRRGAVQALCAGAISLFVVNAGYGFHGSLPRLGDLTFVSRAFGGEGATHSTQAAVPIKPFADSWVGNLPLLVPADYVMGIDLQRIDFERPMKSYMAGHWSLHGWWYYYLYALALKLPLGFLVLGLCGLALVVVAAIRRRDPTGLRDRFVLLFPALFIFAFVSSQTGFSHHMRYVLPCFPFVIIATGATAAWAEQRRGYTAKVGLTLLLGLGIASSLRVYPHSLSYFNEAAGGPESGAEHLDNSNIDWGQDLLYVKTWLEVHPEARPFGLAYFGVIDPRVLGIDFVMAPPVQGITVPASHASSPTRGPHPGYFAISVNYLFGTTFICFKHADEQPTPCGGKDFEYFRLLSPIARAGYSIYIYHLTFDEANELRYQFGYDPLPPEAAVSPTPELPR